MKKIFSLLFACLCMTSMWGFTYTKVTSAPTDWSGEYVIAAQVGDEVRVFTGVDAANNYVVATLNGEGKITNDNLVTVTIAARNEGGYTIKVNGGTNDAKYISSGSSGAAYSNGLKFVANGYQIDLAYASNAVQMTQTIASGADAGKKMYLLYNNTASNYRFRFFKDSNFGNNSYITPVLYKKDAATGVKVTGVTLDKETASIIVGGTTTLAPTIAPANADDKTVTWSTSDDKIATVDNGVVTGVGTGNATITVKTNDGDFTATCEVTVSAIPAGGVSLDKTSLTIIKGERETLVATVTPATAANKNVTWNSNNEAVATVADGVVTAVSTGEATITVTTVDGGYTATCDIVVVASPYQLAYTFDFTVNNFKLPTSAQKNKEGEYTYDGKTIKLYGDATNGFKFSSGYLIMGKEGAYLTLPAFDFPVGKIVIEGRTEASGSVVQNIYVGETAVSTATTGAKVANTYIINKNYRAAGNVYTIKVTSAHNTQITAVKIYRQLSEDITISSAGYATYFNADLAFELPKDVEGYVFFGGAIEKIYENEAIVPAGEPIVLKAAQGSYTLNYATSEEDSYKEQGFNDLQGAATAMTAAEMVAANPGMSKFYALSLNAAEDASSVGFYWIKDNGAAFDISAGKAYLALPAGPGAPARFVFGQQDVPTEVVNVNDNNQSTKVLREGRLYILRDGNLFDLNGRLVK